MAKSARIEKTCLVCGKPYMGNRGGTLFSICAKCRVSPLGRRIVFRMFIEREKGMPAEELAQIAAKMLRQEPVINPAGKGSCLVCGAIIQDGRRARLAPMCRECLGTAFGRALRRGIYWRSGKGWAPEEIAAWAQAEVQARAAAGKHEAASKDCRS